jgi:hypothetical protein
MNTVKHVKQNFIWLSPFTNIYVFANVITFVIKAYFDNPHNFSSALYNQNLSIVVLSGTTFYRSYSAPIFHSELESKQDMAYNDTFKL